MPHFNIAILQTEVDGQLPEGDTLTAKVLSVSADIFRDRRELKQHFILYTTQPMPALVSITPLDDSESNDPDHCWVSGGIRELAEKFAARAIYTVSEIWFGTLQAAGGIPDDYRVRNDPNRKEAAMVQVENPLARPPMQLWTADIDRKHGRPRLLDWKRLVDPENGNPPSVEGRLAYLLPREAYGAVGRS